MKGRHAARNAERALEAGWCHWDEEVEVEWKGRRCRRRSNPSLPPATRSLLTGMRLPKRALTISMVGGLPV